MQRIHIIGKKNHGKTTLIVELVHELTGRRLTVGTIKHTHHRHELDAPGKDSQLHRLAGASTVGVLSRTMSAVFVTHDANTSEEDRYAVIAPQFVDCDLVLVEGDVSTSAPKIEVWRGELDTPPLAACDPSVLAIITDDALVTDRPVLARSHIGGVADWILQQMISMKRPDWPGS